MAAAKGQGAPVSPLSLGGPSWVGGGGRCRPGGAQGAPAGGEEMVAAASPRRRGR